MTDSRRERLESQGLWAQPRRLRVEAATACQLRCPLCPTASGLVGERLGTGFLDPQHLARLLDDNPHIRQVELSNYGEVFLHPHLSRILALGAERGVALTLDNGVNLNRVGEGVLEDLVRYRLRALTCSIDGVTQEVYSRYRVRGDVAEVLTNLRRLVEYKRRYNSPHPRLTWQFILFAHNHHELPGAREMAAELGMEFRLKKSWSQDWAPPEPVEAQPTFAPQPGTFCAQLWDAPQINYDGRLLGCCVNCWGDFGPNVFVEGLEQALNGQRMVQAREVVMGRAEPEEGLPCKSCRHYREMRQAQSWVRRP